MPQVTMIFMLALGLNSHVIIIPLILSVAGRDSWLAVCLSTLFIILGMMVIQYVIHVSKQRHIGIWLREHVSPMFANALLCLMAVPLFLGAIVTLRDTVTWAKIYLPTTPTWALIIPLVALCFYTAYRGISSIAITSGIILPLVVLLGFFVGTANLPHKDFALLFPILENGWSPVAKAIFYSTSGLSELFAVLCLQHCVKTDIRYWMLAANALILVFLTLGPLYGALTEFGPTEAANLRYPPYEEWRLVTFGHFFEHLDFMALYQWVSGAVIRISLFMFLTIEIFGVKNVRKRTWYLTMLFGVAVGFALIPISAMLFSYLLEKFFVPETLYSVTAVVLFTFIIAFSSRMKGVQT